MTSFAELQIDGRIATVTLSRPEARNAIATHQDCEDLVAAIAAAGCCARAGRRNYPTFSSWPLHSKPCPMKRPNITPQSMRSSPGHNIGGMSGGAVREETNALRLGRAASTTFFSESSP
jgi:hypothetical protein